MAADFACCLCKAKVTSSEFHGCRVGAGARAAGGGTFCSEPELELELKRCFNQNCNRNRNRDASSAESARSCIYFFLSQGLTVEARAEATVIGRYYGTRTLNSDPEPQSELSKFFPGCAQPVKSSEI